MTAKTVLVALLLIAVPTALPAASAASLAPPVTTAGPCDNELEEFFCEVGDFVWWLVDWACRVTDQCSPY
jgi:hypothetical protein